jgi:predicted Zn-dependent protease with MMP-like domain
MAKRRRGSRLTTRRPRAHHVRFDILVDRAVAGIPRPFRDVLGTEVALVIEDDPNPDQRRENGLEPGDTLYGLYEGVPRSEWGADWSPFPTKITLFRLPLEADFPDPDDLAEEVRITVLHELAHHLGIDEERMQELGID